jgi:hypothetical protein
MDTYVSGTTRDAPALALALALPAMLSTWMLNQPDILGQAPADGNPLAAISDVGQTVAGQNISLDAKASFDPANSSNMLTYAWNFGDGTAASGVAVNHTYKTPGNYILTLTVSSPEGKRSIRKFLNVGIKPNIYANPYSPLRGMNIPNPAMKVPVANNNLPAQPLLKPPLIATPTSTTRETTETVASPVTTPLVRMTPTASIGTSKFLLLLGLGLAIVILSIVTLLVAGIVRRRG